MKSHFNTIALTICGWWVAFSTHACLPSTFSSVRLSLNVVNWFYTSRIDSINYLMCLIKSRVSLFLYSFRLFYILITGIKLSSWNQIGVLHRKVFVVVLLFPISHEWDIVFDMKVSLNFQQHVRQMQALCSQSWVEFLTYTYYWEFTLSTIDGICRL